MRRRTGIKQSVFRCWIGLRQVSYRCFEFPQMKNGEKKLAYCIFVSRVKNTNKNDNNYGLDLGIKNAWKWCTVTSSLRASIEMCSLIQALISVALLSSAAFGLPLAEESVVDDLSLDLPVSGFGSPPNDDNRIYGGTEASIGQFPHQIAVRFAYVLTCGGSIISDRFIITSAQCKVSRRNLFTVLVGSHTGRRDGIIYEVEEFIVHERYKSSKTETAVIIRNDIGLIKTEEPIKFNKQIAPIALQSTFVGGEVHTLTSGWGDSNVIFIFYCILS